MRGQIVDYDNTWYPWWKRLWAWLWYGPDWRVIRWVPRSEEDQDG